MHKTAQHFPTLRLGDILVEREIITEDQLATSIRYQSETGARIGEALMQLGFITSLDTIRDRAAATGARSLREDGRLKVLQGVTTVGEVLRVTT